MQKQLLFDIYHNGLRDQVVEEIFLLSGMIFFSFFSFTILTFLGVAFSKLLPPDSLKVLITSLSKIRKDPYLTLLRNI